MNKVKLIPLNKVAFYSNKRIDSNLLSDENYIWTDNLLQNKKWKVSANYTPETWKVCKYNKWDILVSNIRPYLKKIWYANNEGWSSADVLTFSVNEWYDSKFIYYSLFRDDFFSHMMIWSKWTKMPRWNKDQVVDFPISDFDHKHQKKISSILSSLDSKIELNNKINSELEKIAKTLYDYWFVQFDFPDENWEPYKSSGWKIEYNEKLKREIPEGWEVENLKNNKLTKLIKPWIDIFENEKIYLATADVSNNEINYLANKITYEKRESRANMQAIKNSIWFAKMKNTKKVLYFWGYSNYLIENFILSTWFAWLECKDYTLEYIWWFINNNNFEFIKDRLSNWATQEAINNDWLEQIKLIIPKDEILKRYHEKTFWIYKKIYLNQIENQKLAELRDWLLPMLMNGQVSVK